MAKKHINIPVFIPHLGCPHACVFCDQKTISGHGRFDINTVPQEIERVLATLPDDTEKEIAFFGGSFTGIDTDLMRALLDIAQRYVDDGQVTSIRLSTRPDYVDDQVLQLLSRYAVRTIELGLQSFDDRVLLACERGHDRRTAIDACRRVTHAGFSLVGQMMIGLPLSDGETERETAEMICRLGASGARVYPTVVFRGTTLCRMAEEGKYTCLSGQSAVERTADVLEIFDRARVPVLRVGLCASEELSDPGQVYGGASDSAIGEMAMGEVFFRRMSRLLTENKVSGGTVRFVVPRGAISRAVGQRKVNRLRLCRQFHLSDIRFAEDETLHGYEIRLLYDEN